MKADRGSALWSLERHLIEFCKKLKEILIKFLDEEIFVKILD